MSLIVESCSIEEACAAAGGSEKLLIELRDKLQEWLESQPHLPQECSKQRLEWLILSTKMSLEVSKQKLDMYYTIRRLVPELFANRDPRSPSITTLRSVMQYVMLPKLTPEKYNTFIFRATVNDASKYEPWAFHKYAFMLGELRLLEYKCLSLGDVYVFDLSMISLSHVMKITPTLIRKCDVAATKGFAVKIKGIHFINAQPFIDRLVTMVKSILKPKIAARVHVHKSDNIESLYKFVPKSILPKDYGGDEQSMAELSDSSFKAVDACRDWFLNQGELLADESLRPGAPFDEDSIFGFSGSFRKLDVD